MKRICFLLTFFLTGFSLVANKQSLRNTYLLACTDEVYEIDLGAGTEIKEFAEAENESTFNHQSFTRTANFVCFVRK